MKSMVNRVMKILIPAAAAMSITAFAEGMTPGTYAGKANGMDGEMLYFSGQRSDELCIIKAWQENSESGKLRFRDGIKHRND